MNKRSKLNKSETKVLVFGATGMLGHTLLSFLSGRENLVLYATARNRDGLSSWFTPEICSHIHSPVDVDNFDSILRVLVEIKPDVVINCIGIIKQQPAANDSIVSINVNALFPHRLALACQAVTARLIHISTDCVFKGDRGNYTESDPSDALDLYGRSKFLGEVSNPHCVTLRTSIIGHELRGKHGLVDWFLAQNATVPGFTNAIFTGIPTVELARIIAEHVIPNTELTGLYHVSSEPVSKYELLRMVAQRYGKDVEIERYEEFHCNRSLDSTRFRSATGWIPLAWPNLVDAMYLDWEK
jgi:dTDP-4-dehydrorhamnose reductase